MMVANKFHLSRSTMSEDYLSKYFFIMFCALASVSTFPHLMQGVLHHPHLSLHTFAFEIFLLNTGTV